MNLVITPKLNTQIQSTNNKYKKCSTVTNVSFAAKMPVNKTLFEQFNEFLKANQLTIECGYEPKYQPKNKKYIIEPYYYANLVKNGKSVNRKGDSMNLFGVGKNSNEDAISNLINKISGYKLCTDTMEIGPFLPDGCKEKTLRAPLKFDIINI